MFQTFEFTFEQSIIHHLVIKTIDMDDYSLYYGKLGISIALFEYGKYSNVQLYIEFAEELLDNFLSKITIGRSIDLSHGWCGIGWGIEYLIQREFINFDSNAICEDIDNIIMSFDIKRITDLTLETGIEGILHYLLARIIGSQSQNNLIPYDLEYLERVNERLICIPPSAISEDLSILIGDFNLFMDTGVCNYKTDLFKLVKFADFRKQDILHGNLGLYQGLAGNLLKMIIIDK